MLTAAYVTSPSAKKQRAYPLVVALTAHVMKGDRERTSRVARLLGDDAARARETP